MCFSGFNFEEAGIFASGYGIERCSEYDLKMN